MAFTTPGTAVAGEVLTAAFWNTNVRDNLNALDDAGANAVGLELIQSFSATSATSFSANNVFTSDFKAYRIVSTGGVSTTATGGNMTLRFRASGSDNSTSNYSSNHIISSAGSLTNAVNVGQTSAFIMHSPFATAGSRWGSFSMDIMNPADSSVWTHASAIGHGVNAANNDVLTIVFMSLRVQSAFDGFTIFYPFSSTTNLSVYGYRSA